MQPIHLKIATYSVHKLFTLSVKMQNVELFGKDYLKMIILKFFKWDFSAWFLLSVNTIKNVVTGQRQKSILPVEEIEAG